ncbi:hypothetical protein [Pseudomonas sp. PAMC 29040]|uniref:hypothetical protein n=1 Tax=Pseudomonas sp. PAMC 29040 TaxID=2498450 RepID=UPI001404510E|nr:hypothetical protein [Pseudomonas sp. PAMC 29040]
MDRGPGPVAEAGIGHCLHDHPAGARALQVLALALVRAGLWPAPGVAYQAVPVAPAVKVLGLGSARVMVAGQMAAEGWPACWQ